MWPSRISLEGSALPIFPCRADKKPACPHGFYDAVSDPNDVADLFRRYPAPLIGVPTGSASGIDAVDIDPRHGGDRWLAEHRTDIPQTRTHETPSGGFHLLFCHAPGLRCSADDRIAHGVDVRSTGGYIVYWPRHACRVLVEGPIADWPEWLLQEAMKPKARSAERRDPNTRALAHHVGDLTDALRKLDPSGYRDHDRWLQLMTACRAVGIARSDFIEWSIGDENYANDGEVIARRWDSLAPKHGGALWAALAEAGIKLAQACHAGESVGHPLTAIPTRNLKARLHSIQRAVERAQAGNREPALFWGSCRMADIIAEPRSTLTPSTATALLMSAAHFNGLLRDIGKEEVQRTIVNGLRWVEEKLLTQTEIGQRVAS
jgi:Bifunctional DNA primase/polymerase, N-terminal/Primase C terminal 2 (PriCT-2)